jgi:cytochrome c biogenesis protein CcmG/thiol:disulfide interchange protein DsbE
MPEAAVGAQRATPARRRSTAAKWSAAAVGLVLVVLVSVLATRQPASMTPEYSPLVGKMAPNIDATSFTGSRISLASFRGRWVVVNFFASWCEACQTEEPQLEQFLYSVAGHDRPMVLGVLFSDSEANGKSFQQSAGASWPSVVDPGGTIASSYGVGNLPRSFLVDPQGNVVASITGAVTASGLAQLITRDATGGS